MRKILVKIFGGHYHEGGWDYYLVGYIPMKYNISVYKIKYYAELTWIRIKIKYYEIKLKIK